jgi:RNA polymerase sigma-70 factor (ECF subfamily)
MEHSDEYLLQEIAKGDSAAFSEFYDRYSRLIYGALMRILKNKDESDDILQDVFLLVWHKGHTFRQELGSPRNWLIRIAHNRAINLIRSARLRREKVTVNIPEDDTVSLLREFELIEETLFDNAINIDRKEMLTLAFDSLPKDRVELLDLAFFKGYSHSEISQQLAMPLGTVKTKIRRSLLALRKSLHYVESEFT